MNEKSSRIFCRIHSDPNMVVVFQDEVHFNIQTTVTRIWALKGSKPRIRSYPGRKNVAYSGFVRPDTGELWVTKPGWFNYETLIEAFREFIGSNSLDDGKRYCIVLDNAPWHKKAKRLIQDESNQEYADIRAMADFVSLPPYSPDLNPIEQVWRIARKERTHNRFFPSFDALMETVDSFFLGLSKPTRSSEAYAISAGYPEMLSQADGLCSFTIESTSRSSESSIGERFGFSCILFVLR